MRATTDMAKTSLLGPPILSLLLDHLVASFLWSFSYSALCICCF